jgi:ABC-type phosphate transport system substrate-binding protein
MKLTIVLPLAGWALLGLSTAKAQEVIVNSSVKITEISKADLRDIFTGASSNYKDGSRAVAVNLKSGPARDAFLKNFVGKNDAAYSAAWRALVFSGQAAMPKSFPTEAALIDYVASVPGAIGYVGAPVEHENVKTVPVK